MDSLHLEAGGKPNQSRQIEPWGKWRKEDWPEAAQRVTTITRHEYASSTASRCEAFLSASAASKAATSPRSRRSAKRRSKRSGRLTLPFEESQPKSDSMAREAQPWWT
jgi:hypothetical protein